MARRFALVIASCWALSVVACGGSDGPSGDSAGSAGALSAGAPASGGASGAGGARAGGNAGAATGGQAGSGTAGAPGASGAGGADNVPTACAALAQLVCSKYNACAPTYVAEELGSEPACEATLSTVCTHFATVPRPLDMAACGAAVSAPFCTGFNADRDIPQACLQPPGAQAAGASCNWDFDCASLLCAGNEQSCGACVARGTVGQACDGTELCALDLVCSAGKCGAPSGPNAACDAASQSGCANGNTCSNGTCAPWGQAGADCDAARPCDGPNGFYCSASKCVKVTVAAEGQPCGTAVLSACAAGTSCIGSKCMKAGALGASCGPGVNCVFPLWCANGTCGYEGTSICH